MSSMSDFDLLNPTSHCIVFLMTSKDSLEPNSSSLGIGICWDLVKRFF